MIGAVLAKRATHRAFAAMNRRDLAAFMQAWADDAVFEFPGQSRVSGRFEGKAAIEAWFRSWWTQVSSLQFAVRHVAVEDIFAFGGTNAVTAEWELVERDLDGRSYRLNGVTALKARGGKLVHVRDYIFDTTPLIEMWGPAEREIEPAPAAPAQPVGAAS